MGYVHSSNSQRLPGHADGTVMRRLSLQAIQHTTNAHTNISINPQSTAAGNEFSQEKFQIVWRLPSSQLSPTERQTVNLSYKRVSECLCTSLNKVGNHLESHLFILFQTPGGILYGLFHCVYLRQRKHSTYPNRSNICCIDKYGTSGVRTLLRNIWKQVHECDFY